MHFFGTIGLFFMILGTILISYIVYLKIVFGTILAKLPLLNGGVLSFIMGGQLLSIGLLGELIISKNLYQKNYIVEKKII